MRCFEICQTIAITKKKKYYLKSVKKMKLVEAIEGSEKMKLVDVFKMRMTLVDVIQSEKIKVKKLS